MSFFVVDDQKGTGDGILAGSVSMPLHSPSYQPPRRMAPRKRALLGLSVTFLSSFAICSYLLIGNLILKSEISAPEYYQKPPGSMHSARLVQPDSDPLVFIDEHGDVRERIWNCNGRFTNDPTLGLCKEIRVGESGELQGHKYFTPKWDQ
jgi:hypothetical protein